MGVVNQAGFYAVIPAPVLYDHSLPPRCKLLYAVISNFCNFYGYCTCKNQTFAAYFEVDERTVERMLKQLRDAGHINSEIEKSDGKVKRKIWLTCAEQPDKNVGCLPVKNVGSIKNNNINNNNPPIAPQGAGAGSEKKSRRKSPTGEVILTPELEESWQRFYDAYPIHKDKQVARYRWQQLSPDAALVATILDSIEKLKLTEDWMRGSIPHPSTFLNNRRWEDADDLEKVQEGGGMRCL